MDQNARIARADRHKEQLAANTEWLECIVKRSQDSRFFGRLIIVMEEGIVIRVVREESIRPPP